MNIENKNLTYFERQCQYFYIKGSSEAYKKCFDWLEEGRSRKDILEDMITTLDDLKRKNDALERRRTTLDCKLQLDRMINHE
jgi:hypothetical protein